MVRLIRQMRVELFAGRLSLRRMLLMLMRAGAFFQLVIGVAMWTGHWYSWVNVHRATGAFYVLLLWSLAVFALVRWRSPGIALFAIVWGFGILALGFTQETLLPGRLHWVVRVVHPLIGLAALWVAEDLAPRPQAPGAETAGAGRQAPGARRQTPSGSC